MRNLQISYRRSINSKFKKASKNYKGIKLKNAKIIKVMENLKSNNKFWKVRDDVRSLHTWCMVYGTIDKIVLVV